MVYSMEDKSSFDAILSEFFSKTVPPVLALSIGHPCEAIFQRNGGNILGGGKGNIRYISMKN